MRGHGLGEEVAAERTIGEEGGEERKGTRIAYRVRIKSLRRKRLPEVDDGFAKSVGVEEGVETVTGSACGSACVPRTPSGGAMRGGKP